MHALYLQIIANSVYKAAGTEQGEIQTYYFLAEMPVFY